MRKVIFKASYWYHEEIDNSAVIHIGGRTADNKTVHILVRDFQPHAYLELPKRVRWNASKCQKLVDYLGISMKEKGPVNDDIKDAMCEKELLLHNQSIYALKLNFPTENAARNLSNRCNYARGFAVPDVGNFRPGEFKSHEHNVDAVLKFTAAKSLSLAGWICAEEMILDDEEDLTEEERKFSTCDIDMNAFWDDVNPYTMTEKVYINPTYCAFDIECYSKNHNSRLPNPAIPENVVNQISLIFGTIKNEDRHIILLSLGNPQQIGNAHEIKVYKSESAMLLDFAKFIQKYDPDAFVGYNIMKFDWHYLIKRAELNGIYNKFLMLGRIDNKKAEIRTMTWSSSAYKKQEFFYPECHGRINIDVLLEVERNYRLPKYTLDLVSEHFLGKHKDDVSARGMFMIWQMTFEILRELEKEKLESVTLLQLIKYRKKIKDIFPIKRCHTIVKKYRQKLLSSSNCENFISILREGMEIVGKYCVQDSLLAIDLCEKLNLSTTMEEMSNVMNVPMSYLYTRGQQIKVVAQLYRDLTTHNFVLPFIPKVAGVKKEKYEGAKVIEAHPGFYLDVGTMDFNSLYPCLIISFNICPSTFMKDDDPISDDECHIVEFDHHFGCEHDPKKRKLKKGETIICKHHRYRYRKIKFDIAKDGTITRLYEGSMPRLERNLLAERKVHKKEMFKAESLIKMNDGVATEGDLKYYKAMKWEIIEKNSLSPVKAKNTETDFVVNNAKQLSVKVASNSCYGSWGADGMVYFGPGAASVTAMGRKFIMMAIERIKKEYPFAKLVYGDSVSKDTPILCRWHGKIFYRTIDNLPVENTFRLCGDKFYYEPKKGLEVWTEKGFTTLKRVISHQTTKKMYRILTHTGVVDVTEDHSLLDECAKKIRPKQVKKGTQLLHHDLPMVEGKVDNSIAYAMGLFYGDGSCGYYDCKSGKKASWAINNTNLKFLKKAQKQLNKYYIGINKFKILNTMESSHVYKLVAQGEVRNLVEEWREKFYDERKYKKVPDEVFEYSLSSRQAFFDGYYAADGDKDEKGYLRFDNKGKIGAAGLYLLSNSLGYPVSINIRDDKPEIYRLTLTRDGKKQRLHPDKIKKIVELGCTQQEVYDLETENHHFSAGVGRMVVHNTDSCMIQYEGKSFEEAFRIAGEASKVVSHYLKCYMVGISEDYCVGIGANGDNPNSVGIHISKINSSSPEFKNLSHDEKCKVLFYESLPINLEFENFYGKFFLLSKKRYIAYILNKNKEYVSRVKKGMCEARRDTCEFLKTSSKIISGKIMDECSEYEIMDALYDRIELLFTGGYYCPRALPDKCLQPNQLIIYTGINGLMDYAKQKEFTLNDGRSEKVYIDVNGNIIDDPIGPMDPRLVYPNLPQVLLARKLYERGEEVPANTRLEYIYLKNDKAEHQGEKAEDYGYYMENKGDDDIVNSPDYMHYFEKQLSKPITELITVRYPRPVIPYIPIETKFKIVTDKFNKLHSCRLANVKTLVKKRPLSRKCKNLYIGWDVIDILECQYGMLSVSTSLKNRNPSKDATFEKYTLKGDHAKVTYILDDIRKAGECDSLNCINEKLYPGITDVCQTWKSMFILGEACKYYHSGPRKWNRPPFIGPSLRVNTNIILLRNFKDSKEGDVGIIVNVIIKDKKGVILDPKDIKLKKIKPQSLEYFYDLLMGESNLNIKLLNVPRDTFTTFTKKDENFMKKMLSYRKKHALMLKELKSCFPMNFI